MPGAPPRPAATLMVVRDGGHPSEPLEVLMLQRNLRSDFVGGAHVFPGGAVDPADRGEDLEQVCDGRDDAGASAVLGIGSGGLAYFVAAVRECFEEAGLLLARRQDGSQLSFADPDESERFSGHRRALNAGRRTFLDIVRAEGLRLSVDRLHYFAHWITPEGSPRRYDTRFFAAAAPPDQSPAHDAAETVADLWIRPSDALAQHRAGAIELILPTIRSLQAIGRFATAAQLLDAAARDAGAVPAVLPRMVTDTGGARLLLPGDPGYEQAAGHPTVGDDFDFDAAARAASRAANP